MSLTAEGEQGKKRRIILMLNFIFVGYFFSHIFVVYKGVV
jgi:hypothetical protein